MFGTLKLMVGGDDDSHDLDSEHSAFSALLHFCFICLVIVAVVILLNLTISVVSDVWSQISETIDVIITHGRASLILE